MTRNYMQVHTILPHHCKVYVGAYNPRANLPSLCAPSMSSLLYQKLDK
jgi:hypothetical protein